MKFAKWDLLATAQGVTPGDGSRFGRDIGSDTSCVEADEHGKNG